MDNDDTAIVPSVVNQSQVAILTNRTPRDEVRYRKGKGGRDYPYTDPAYVIRTLNEAFGYDWDFEIVKDELVLVNGKPFEFSVLGRLTIKVGVHTIVKSQYGSQTIEFVKKDGEPTDEPVSIGDAKKGAASDALKKCASEIGVALDVYDSDSDLYQKKPISVVQFDLLKRWVETCEEASLAGIRENFNISSEDTRETIIARGKALKLMVDTKRGPSSPSTQPDEVDNAPEMVLVNGKKFSKDQPVGAASVNGADSEWFKTNIVKHPYFADENGKFIRSHYDNHLKSHFGLSSASNMTGEMLLALYNHIRSLDSDPRWYPVADKKEPSTFNERIEMRGLAELYTQWKTGRVVTLEDQAKLDTIFSQLFEMLDTFPDMNVKTPEGLAELNKHIEDAWAG